MTVTCLFLLALLRPRLSYRQFDLGLAFKNQPTRIHGNRRNTGGRYYRDEYFEGDTEIRSAPASEPDRRKSRYKSSLYPERQLIHVIARKQYAGPVADRAHKRMSQ